MGRGRGRKFGQSRPPPAIRSSMQELGMTATANYVGSISDVLGVSVDAARAYFPPLPEDSVASAVAPSEAEFSLLDRVQHLEKSLRESPIHADADTSKHANPVPQGNGTVGSKKKSKKKEKNGMELEAMTASIANYFLNSNGAKKKGGKQRVSMDIGEWIIPEILPDELRPAQLKGRKTASANENGTTPNKKKMNSDSLQLLSEEAETAHPMHVPGDEAAEFGDEEANEEPDDTEEVADYITAGRFDDDDGYEEADSGEEGPTIM